MSHPLLQLYPLAVSINTYMLTIHNFFSSCPLHLYLEVFAASGFVSYLNSWLFHNGMVLNPTKTEAICFGTSPQLQSLSNLTSIKVAGTSVPLVTYVKLLGVTFDSHLNFYKYISNVCSSSYFRIMLSANFTLFLTQKRPRPLPVLLSFPD